MIYDVPAITVMARSCAPAIATEAVVPLVVTESGGDSLQINVNHGPRLRAGSATEGAAIARRYVAAGYTVDVGLAQINSSNLARLGVSFEQAFDPCTNLQLASAVLQASYVLATRRYAGLDAIAATYSLYNTGTLTRGFRNGYVGRVWSVANALGSVQSPAPAPRDEPVTVTASRATSGRDAWVVGPIASTTIDVFK